MGSAPMKIRALIIFPEFLFAILLFASAWTIISSELGQSDSWKVFSSATLTAYMIYMSIIVTLTFAEYLEIVNPVMKPISGSIDSAVTRGKQFAVISSRNMLEVYKRLGPGVLILTLNLISLILAIFLASGLNFRFSGKTEDV